MPFDPSSALSTSHLPVKLRPKAMSEADIAHRAASVMPRGRDVVRIPVRLTLPPDAAKTLQPRRRHAFSGPDSGSDSGPAAAPEETGTTLRPPVPSFMGGRGGR